MVKLFNGEKCLYERKVRQFDVKIGDWVIKSFAIISTSGRRYSNSEIGRYDKLLLIRITNEESGSFADFAYSWRDAVELIRQIHIIPVTVSERERRLKDVEDFANYLRSLERRTKIV